MYKNKVEIFLETGSVNCKHHGTHSEWALNPLKKHKKGNFRSLQCKKCTRNRSKQHREKNPNCQDDYRFSFNGTIVRILAQARLRAKKKRYLFELDVVWVKEKLITQNYKCVYSGIEFDFSRPEYDQNRKYLPSIDQNIAGLGYTKENSEIVCSIVNMMKLDTPYNDFITLCEKIVKHNKK